MTAFERDTLAADFARVQRVLADFVAARSLQDWSRKAERRAKGWTLHETLAHLAATAEAMVGAMDNALRGLPVSLSGITRRAELAAYNAREIAARESALPQTLADALFAAFDRCVEHCTKLSERELALAFPIPFYNRPLTVAESLGWQLIHPGIVHAAQLANGAGVAPLWVHYPPDLMHRQITRFFNIMSHSYWPERGGSLRTSVNFLAAGSGGGQWHVTLAPDGGGAGEGGASRPALTVWTPSAHALCRLLTIQIGPVGALLRGQMLAWGNIGLGFKIPYLFVPT